MRTRIFVGVVALAAAQVGAVPSARAAATEATVIDAGGCVREASGAECKVVAGGTMVATQGSFVAGKMGNRIRLGDGSELTLAPDTEVQVLPTLRLALGGSGSVRGQVVQVVRGRCEVVVAGTKTAPSAVMIRGAGRLGAIAKAGMVVVRANADSLAVANVTGKALAGSGNEWGDVPPGKVRVVSKTDPKGAPRELTAAPISAPSRDVAVAVGAIAEGPVEASWLPVAGATGYEVVVRRDTTEVARRFVAANETTAAFGGLEVGTYTASVRAFDADGVITRWSTPSALFVAGIVLPGGALRGASGSIQLPPGRSVKLVPFDGLEVGLGLAWLPSVPAEVGLQGARPQTVRLRRKGNTLERTIFLEPRTASARVELSPRNPQWPGPPVQVRVTLTDKTGGPPPTGVKLVPRVAIDVTPIEVTWREENGAMLATVEQRDTARPHAVRVEVEDQFGVELGRGFIEVAPAVAPPPVK